MDPSVRAWSTGGLNKVKFAKDDASRVADVQWPDVDESSGRFRDTYRRTLGVVERRFGLSLPPACLKEACLPAYAVRGTPNMSHLTDRAGRPS